MKNFNFLFLLLLSISCFSQQKQSTDFYLNSVKIDLQKVYINDPRLSSVNVEKKSANGSVSIFTKDSLFTYLTLTDILRKYTHLKTDENSILFQIKDKVVQDTVGVKIDDSYFIYVDVINLSDVKYLKDKFKQIKIVRIDLDKWERKPEIRIRGNEFVYLKDSIN